MWSDVYSCLNHRHARLNIDEEFRVRTVTQYTASDGGPPKAGEDRIEVEFVPHQVLQRLRDSERAAAAAVWQALFHAARSHIEIAQFYVQSEPGEAMAPILDELLAAAGRGVYCWTVDKQADVTFCRDVGVNWVATNHPDRTREWLGD